MRNVIIGDLRAVFQVTEARDCVVFVEKGTVEPVRMSLSALGHEPACFSPVGKVVRAGMALELVGPRLDLSEHGRCRSRRNTVG